MIFIQASMEYPFFSAIAEIFMLPVFSQVAPDRNQESCYVKAYKQSGFLFKSWWLFKFLERLNLVG